MTMKETLSKLAKKVGTAIQKSRETVRLDERGHNFRERFGVGREQAPEETQVVEEEQ